MIFVRFFGRTDRSSRMVVFGRVLRWTIRRPTIASLIDWFVRAGSWAREFWEPAPCKIDGTESPARKDGI